MDPLQLRKMVLRWTPPVVLLALLGAAVAFVLTLHETPRYQATGRVLVLGQVEASALSLSPDQIISTDASLMTQPPLLRRVIDDLHLPMSVDQLSQEISVTQEGKTELIDVSVTDPDAGRAAGIANAVISDFVASAQKHGATAPGPAITQLQQQVSSARQQVQLDQTVIDSARRANSSTTAAQAQFDADNGRLAQLTTQLAQLSGQQEQTGKAIDIASPATAPASPLASRRTTAVGLGAFSGVLIGISLALALQYLDQGLRTEEDVRQRLGLPTLGMIPIYRSSEGRLRRRARYRDASHAGEAYRRLRTSLLFSSLDTPLRSIVITSATSGEGKTRTAANLAGVMAAAGERVLLVDADMRRPMQHRLFDEPLEDGVSELLLHAARADAPPVNGRHHTGFANLSLLPAGTIPPNPSELLASKTTVGVLRRLEKQFDLVVIDTPPVQVVTDAVSLAASGSATILVVESGRTNARQATKTIADLRAVGANIVGVVLNKVHRRVLSAYSYYYYYADPTTPAAAPAAWRPIGEIRGKADAGKR